MSVTSNNITNDLIGAWCQAAHGQKTAFESGSAVFSIHGVYAGERCARLLIESHDTGRFYDVPAHEYKRYKLGE